MEATEQSCEGPSAAVSAIVPLAPVPSFIGNVAATTGTGAGVTRTAQKRKRVGVADLLEEEVYTGCLARIIERDFYPDLPHLRAFNRREDERGVPADSPPGGVASTPSTIGTFDPDVDDGTASTVSRASAFGSRGKLARDVTMGLDRFQAAYTSEDNHSFCNILDAAAQTHRERHRWFYDHDLTSKRMTDSETSKQLLVAPAPSSVAGYLRWPYQSQNALMFVPDGHTPDRMAMSRAGPKCIARHGTRFDRPLPSMEVRELS